MKQTKPQVPGLDGAFYTVALPGQRNLAHNGHMLVNQRGITSYSASGSFLVDRFPCYVNSAGSFSAGTGVGAYTPPAGFTKLLAYQVTATASVSSTSYAIIQQSLEGLNIQHLGWGQSWARPVVVSFWAACTVPGTYCLVLRNATTTYSYTANFTLADTGWHLITILVPGCTTGTWLTDSSSVLSATITLVCGSTYQAPVTGAWQAGNYIGSAAMTQLCLYNSAVFAFTGFQIEAGTYNTPFEFRFYDDELRHCQRYLAMWGGENLYDSVGISGFALNTTTAQVYVPLFTPMRAIPSSPTYSAVGDWGIQYYTGAVTPCNSITLAAPTSKVVKLQIASASAVLTAGAYVSLIGYNTNNARLYVSAEI